MSLTPHGLSLNPFDFLVRAVRQHGLILESVPLREQNLSQAEAMLEDEDSDS